MPNRYLREPYISSERINAVSLQAEVLWTHLVVTVDDWGRCEANPKLLRPKLFPLRLDHVREADVTRWLAECEKANLVRLYSHNGKDYLQMEVWERGRAEKSKCPEPPVANICAQPLASVSDGEQPHLSPTPTPIPIPASTPTTIPTSPAAAGVEGFEEFWQAYPRRAGKGDAEKAWSKLKLASRLPEILTAIRAAKVSLDWTKEAGQFIPYPATWLNRRGWEDQLQPARPAASAGLDKSKTIPLTPEERPPIWRP